MQEKGVRVISFVSGQERFAYLHSLAKLAQEGDMGAMDGLSAIANGGQSEIARRKIRQMERPVIGNLSKL